MEQTKAQEPTVAQPGDASAFNSAIETSPARTAVTPQATATSCPTCAAAQAGGQASSPSHVYVLGHIEPLFPLLSVKKEAWQATAREGDAAKGTDSHAMQKVLENPNNRYLVRQLCWVMSVQGIETYILVPRDPVDYQLLVNAYRSEPKPGDLELVIGFRGPMASPFMCNGLLVPIVVFDQIYPFDRESLLEAASAKEPDTKKFKAAAGEMFDRIMRQSDNAGITDADRALNYLAVRYSRIYATAASEFAKNASFTSIDVHPSPLSGTRKIVDVVFAFTARDTDVASKYFVRVDVTEEFPFLVTQISPYYDR